MTARRFTLRTSHLLMWSSPLLLLVLVFTLTSRPLHPVTSSSTSATARASTGAVASTTHPQIARRANSTTTPARAPTTTTTTPTTPTTTTFATNVAVPTALVPPTSVASSTSSHAATVTSAATSATGGARTGTLTLEAPAVVVPLRGPGSWSLLESHAVSSTLQCPRTTRPVSATVHLADAQTCQLAITIATSAPTSWTLRRTH